MKKAGAHLKPKQSSRPQTETSRSQTEAPRSRTEAPRSHAEAPRSHAEAPRSHAEAPRSRTETQRPTRDVTVSPTSAARTSHAGPPSHARSRGRSRRGGKKFPMWPIFIVLIAVLVFAGWKLVSILFQYSKDRKAYDDVIAMAVSTVAPQQTDENGTVVEYIPMDSVPITVDWAALQSVNPEIIAWLYSADTIINYPIVQTSNNTYYLNHSFDLSSNSAGCLFADLNAVVGVTQSNYIVYGHNMKDESMFGTLKNYVNESYYTEHPVMFLLTPTQNYRIELICCRTIEATENNYPGYFSSTTSYQSYLNSISSDAYWLKSNYLSTDYQLITLSTCTSSSNYSDPRLVVQGALVPIA